ncbi:MAG: ABC transporter substrate-binding protein, partial [Oligoflexia bacterium]|nr:ABC transporter substrate-binding protein [Oligoflexia bacterium]
MRIRVGALGLLILGISYAPVTVAEAPAWKIGLLLCFSGDCAADGVSARQGATIAAAEINANGGVLGRMIEFDLQDTAEAVSGAKAVSAYRALRMNRELKYILGPSWTPAGLALAPIVSRDRDVIMMSPSLGAAEFHLAGDNIFNIRGTDEISSRTEARYAYGLGARTAAIMSSQQPWEAQQAAFFEDEFTKLGGKILVKEEPLPTVTDLRSETLRITQHKPDVVFLASIVLMDETAKELQNLRYSGPKIASTIDEVRIAESAGALNGAVFYSFQKPEGDFRSKYQTTYGRLPEGPAAMAYDAIYAFTKAVRASASFDPQTVKKQLLAVNFEGASGNIQFDAQGCAIRSPQAWRVEGASYVALDT